MASTVYSCAQQSPPLVPELSQINPIRSCSLQYRYVTQRTLPSKISVSWYSSRTLCVWRDAVKTYVSDVSKRRPITQHFQQQSSQWALICEECIKLCTYAVRYIGHTGDLTWPRPQHTPGSGGGGVCGGSAVRFLSGFAVAPQDGMSSVHQILKTG